MIVHVFYKKSQERLIELKQQDKRGLHDSVKKIIKRFV